MTPATVMLWAAAGLVVGVCGLILVAATANVIRAQRAASRATKPIDWDAEFQRLAPHAGVTPKHGDH